nr:hypothetical protein [Tanacetum cinerariifolium]
KDTENHVTHSWILEVPSAFQETFAELQAVGAAFQIVLFLVDEWISYSFLADMMDVSVPCRTST